MKSFVIGGVSNEEIDASKIQQFRDDCFRIGKFLFENGHSLVICSPFKSSADYWVLKGFYSVGGLKENQVANIHYVEDDTVKEELNKTKNELEIEKLGCILHPKLISNSSTSMRYSWLLCQLEALEECDFVIAIGGRIDGSASMLLRLAESKRKLIVPLPFWNGAAAECFYRKEYELRDRLGDDYKLLGDHIKILESGNLNKFLSKDKKYSNNRNRETLKVFISYSRARASEADCVEILLRRRNLQVFRDETEFGAGNSIHQKIIETLRSSNIFIAMWCNDYACSPWCFDEFELALDKHDEKKMDLWILCMDETRIIPKRARDLVNHRVNSHEEIKSVILNLLSDYGI